MTTYEKIKQLCDSKGISIYRLERDCSLSNGSVKKWTNSSPNLEAIQKVAIRLNTTISDLLSEEDVPQLDPTAKRIIKLLDQDEAQQKDFAKTLNVPPSTISDWRSGKTKSYRKMLPDIAKYFNVPLDYLLGVTDSLATSANNLTSYSENEMYTFPVIGAICAGYDGNSEFDKTGEKITVPKHLLKTHNPKDYFVLEVKGNSMYPLYMPGDKVLIRATTSIDSGSIAAVGYDGEDATLKKVEYEPNEDWMRLIPRNPEYPTVTIRGADLEQCRIYGEVVYLFRDKVGF